jgi:hypothetical protein
MNETMPKPEVPRDLVGRVRRSWGSSSASTMQQLSGEAQRLRRALAVAEKWVEAATGSNEMFSEANYTYDKLEEELARVCWDMDVEFSTNEYARAHKNFGGEEATREELDASVSGLLSNALLDAYCILRDAPLETFGVGEREAEERPRYSIMGALLEAMDLIPGEVEAKDEQGER